MEFAGDPRPEQQREVQRLLGRCMLRIQQYEQLMKAILHDHEFAGPVDAVVELQAERQRKLSTKTLGQLVEELFKSFVVPDGFRRELLPEASTPTDRISFSFAHRVPMPREQWEQTNDAVKELVELRNELVHHLIQKFDLWSSEGCLLATRHLEASYQRVDGHFLQLQAWARELVQARTIAADFARSPEFHDLVVNGIAPDGSFDWRDSGIVRALREAMQRFPGQDGWVALDQARAHIESASPEQQPAKYGCRTWPQVLHESKLFDLKYLPGADGKPVASFRLRER